MNKEFLDLITDCGDDFERQSHGMRSSLKTSMHFNEVSSGHNLSKKRRLKKHFNTSITSKESQSAKSSLKDCSVIFSLH